MEKLIIGFSKPKKWKPFAKVIQLGLNIPYSHVYVKFFSEKYNRFLIYQASHSSVNFVGTKIFEDDNFVVKEFEISITPEQKIKVMQFAIDNAGKPYGIKEVIGLAWVRINEIFGKTIKNPFSDGEYTYACSGLTSRLLTVTDLGIKLIKPFDDMTPLDVYNIMKDLNNGEI